MDSLDHLLLKVACGQFTPDILGLPGIEWDDGRVDVFVDGPGVRLRLPAPARDIIRDIGIRSWGGPRGRQA